MTDGSTRAARLATEQLLDIAANGDAVQILSVTSPSGASGPTRFEISLDCAEVPWKDGGIRLRRRERFLITVDGDFPFEIPQIKTPHARWAGTPHVQWGSHLCIYAAPSIEWNPADGMRGLIDRLVLWLKAASLGELDPDDQPLHPPVAYQSPNATTIVIRADPGELAPSPSPIRSARRDDGTGDVRTVAALCTRHAQADRLDVVSWMDLEDLIRLHDAGELARPGLAIAVGVLADRELFFEYPATAAALVAALERAGLSRSDLQDAIAYAAAANESVPDAPSTPIPLHLLVGTPSRRDADGVLRQHLVCWRFDDLGRQISGLLNFRPDHDADRQQLRADIEQLADNWISFSKTSWMRVIEARSEVTTRRDEGSAAEHLRGKRVLVLGAGALGAPAAEMCVRAGVAALTVVDNGMVTAGILVRQPYQDDDIGFAKATALAERLSHIRPDLAVIGRYGDALAAIAGPLEFDLIIDATADARVRSFIELNRSRSRSTWPALMTLLVGHRAERGVVATSPAGSVGGGHHLLRLVALSGAQEPHAALGDAMADFFPEEPRAQLFHPEPGCSAPTFIGSAAELGALSGSLMHAGLEQLVRNGTFGSAAVVRLPQTASGERQVTTVLTWTEPTAHFDPTSDLEVRISAAALAEMRAECRRGARLRGDKVETGGLLLGELDEASGCIWIDVATGPSPDSVLSTRYFQHGTEGVEPLIDHHRVRSRRRTTFMGIWHSHPKGPASPSDMDKEGMGLLVLPTAAGPRRALMVILGGSETTWGAWLDRGDRPDVFVQLVNAADRPNTSRTPSPQKMPRVSQTWAGGWAGAARQSTKRRRRRWRWRR